MKFVKRVAVFLVLCLTAYGTYVFWNDFKKPPHTIPDRDIGYLQDIGIHIQDAQAASSGLSGILSDVEGAAPIGGSTGTSVGGVGSSTPPGFFAAPTGSPTPPTFFDAIPRVAANVEPQFVSHVSSAEVPPPPMGYSEPTDFPIQVPPPPFEVPALATPETPESFNAPSFEVLTPPSETPPISATESPPLRGHSWDGPASDIPVTPPPAEFLQSSNFSPNPIDNPPADAILPVHVQIAPKPVEGTITRLEEGIRKIGPASLVTPLLTTTNSKDRESTFSSPESIPLDIATVSNTRYTQTSSRQPLTFEPVKPEISSTAPVVAFAPPRHTNQLRQLEQTQPEQTQLEQTSKPVISPPVAANPEVKVNAEVKQIGTPRLIEAVTPRVAQPSIRETVARFVRTQQQWAESDDLDNIRQAFIHLSQVYELDQLEDAERELMCPILDALALKVIYAGKTHILEPPYQVKPGETIESIAQVFNLTPTLLRKINGLAMSQELPVGTTLKVVYGQFDARISIQRRELTLLLGGLYAGRFSFSLPHEGLKVPKGEFYVTNRTDRTVVLNNGWVLATDSARNATIVFADKDAREIFDILSEQSVIVVE